LSRLLALLLSALAAALLLGACGDDGDDGGDEISSEEQEIIDVITTSVVSTDPADCTRLQTQAFLEQANFSSGDEAVQQCEEEAADTSDDPEQTDVTNVEVDGTSATADATFAGSVLGGSTVTLALVKEGDQWKLDRIEDIPDFDGGAFRAEFAQQLPQQEGVPPEIADCIVQALEEAGDEQIKTAFLSGDEQQLVGLFGRCVPGAA
jgi:hypothetical protein